MVIRPRSAAVPLLLGILPPLAGIVSGCAPEAPETLSTSPGPPGRVTPRALVTQPVVALNDGAAPVLALPIALSVDPRGAFVVADRSDKDVKAYGPDGRRLRAIGRPGYGPGEFVALATAQAYRDSVAAFDFLGSRISVFDASGRFARALPVRFDGVAKTWSLRVVDDSLFLLVGTPMGAPESDLLALVRPDGSLVSSFFNRRRYFEGDPQLIQRTAVLADARDGLVFAALVGGDSLYVFDYAGRPLAVHPLDPERPLVTSKALLKRNRGRPNDSRGRSVLDGNRIIVDLVALDSATVAVQLVRYDARQGVDQLEGGTLVVSALNGGAVRTLARGQVRGALLGRDREARPLLLAYGSPAGDVHVVQRLLLPERGRNR